MQQWLHQHKKLAATEPWRNPQIADLPQFRDHQLWGPEAGLNLGD